MIKTTTIDYDAGNVDGDDVVADDSVNANPRRSSSVRLD